MFSTWEIVWNWMLHVGEETNPEMDVYRQALSFVAEQLLAARDSRQCSLQAIPPPTHTHTPFSSSQPTHTQKEREKEWNKTANIWGCWPAVVCPSMCQFITEVNASFPGSLSTCHPDKKEPMEVISLLSISLTPSRSFLRGRSGAFTVLCHACEKVEIREKTAVWWTVRWSSSDRGS